MESYEQKCEILARKLEEFLGGLGEVTSDDLAPWLDLLKTHSQLADFKVKFRQADHAKKLLYGPVIISFASLALAIVLAIFSFRQERQTAHSQDIERQRVEISLVLKVLEAPSEEEGKRLLAFFEHARLLTLPSAEREELEWLLRR